MNMLSLLCPCQVPQNPLNDGTEGACTAAGEREFQILEADGKNERKSLNGLPNCCSRLGNNELVLLAS